MGTAYLDGSRDKGRGMEAGSGLWWKEYGEGMVMNGGVRGVILLSSGGDGACGIALFVRGRERLWRLPMYCRFLGIPST